MSWLERRAVLRRFAGPVAALAIASLVGGCFQPLYGDRSLGSSPGVREAMARVDVAQIDAPPATALSRLAGEVRNELTLGLDRGGSRPPPTHRLAIVLTTAVSSLIVDPTTARAEFEIVGLEANYQLVEIASSKAVLTAAATARVSYDIPGQQQRLAALRGQRDAQSRAAIVIAQQIRARVASHFAAPPS